jgi:hypothetical protein
LTRPLGQAAQALAAHRQTLEQKRARLNRAIEALARIEEHPRPADGLRSFMAEAAWERWEEQRRKRAVACTRSSPKRWPP